MNTDRKLDLARRRSLVAGGTIMAGLLSAGKPDLALANQPPAMSGANSGLPVEQIEKILRSDGRVSNGVLEITQDRDDLDNVRGPGGIPFRPAFQVHHDLYFQSLAGGRAIFNGELSLLGRETNPVIDRILANNLVFQAFHQHFFDLSPQIWHIHLRGVGEPLALARAVANVIAATGTPLPQTSPPNPSSPLNARMLGQILGGDAHIQEEGVVSVSVPRRDQIILGGVAISPELGVANEIFFEPLGDGRTAVAPDFSLTASEVNPVMSIMRKAGFTVHCLYNQETAESPQLYFSHQLAVGDAYALARAIRNGLERTNARFK